MLQIKDLRSSYGKVEALRGITIELMEGEIVTLIGGNGAGKTTTLMTLSGLVSATSGKIIFEGKEIQQLSPDQIVALGIVQVPEGRRIFSDFSILENLEMGAYLRRDKAGILHDLDMVYDLFPILKERSHQLGGTLSGGEQQMLAISRGLMSSPKLLLLDEPSLGLAPIIIQQIFEIIKKINKEEKITIFLVEQNAHQALGIANRAYVMENGRIVLEDSASALLKNDDLRKAYLGIS